MISGEAAGEWKVDQRSDCTLKLNNHRGVLARRLDLPGLALAELCHSGGPDDEHSHPDPHFWLTIGGSYQVECGRRSEIVDSAALVYTAANQPHRDHMREANGFGVTLTLNRSFVAEHVGEASLPSDSAIFRNPRILAIARSMRAELYASDASSPLIIAGLALELLGRVCRSGREAGADARIVARAQRIIAERCESDDFSVAALADALSVHPVYLARAFRKALSCSPTDYIRTLRCGRAAELLRSPDVSLSHVAQSCGFGDQSSFTRAFRRTFGTTPGRYRRQS